MNHPHRPEGRRFYGLLLLADQRGACKRDGRILVVNTQIPILRHLDPDVFARGRGRGGCVGNRERHRIQERQIPYPLSAAEERVFENEAITEHANNHAGLWRSVWIVHRLGRGRVIRYSKCPVLGCAPRLVSPARLERRNVAISRRRAARVHDDLINQGVLRRICFDDHCLGSRARTKEPHGATSDPLAKNGVLGRSGSHNSVCNARGTQQNRPRKRSRRRPRSKPAVIKVSDLHLHILPTCRTSAAVIRNGQTHLPAQSKTPDPRPGAERCACEPSLAKRSQRERRLRSAVGIVKYLRSGGVVRGDKTPVLVCRAGTASPAGRKGIIGTDRVEARTQHRDRSRHCPPD